MSKVFDSVLVSSDMSLERVLHAGLPVALFFYEREIPAEISKALDELARRYSGRALFVSLHHSDAPQAVSRFGVRQFPALVTVRDGRTVAIAGDPRQPDLGPSIAYLLGDGPLPATHTAVPEPSPRQAVSATPVTVNERDFDREVLQSDRPVMVDFWAPWCAPCRMVAPILEKLAAEQSNLKIAKVNVDENPGLSGKYRTMSIPTMIIFQGGREVDRWVGAMPENILRSRLVRWTQG